MTQAPSSFASRAYSVQAASLDVGELIPIPVGVITFDFNFLEDVETFEEYRDRILAYGTLLSELNVDPEEVEWNNINGWDYVSDDPVVINEFAVLHDGEVVEPEDYLEPFFVEAVVQEVTTNPRRYPKVDAYELAESLLGQYRVSYDEQNGLGFFRRIEQVEGQEVRVIADLNLARPDSLPDPWQALNDADDVDGSEY
jgi:hypothetical protein